MIKRTIHFSNPAHLSVKNQQLFIELKNEERKTATIPIEDIGMVVVEHPKITFTMGVLDALLENKVALITCDKHYLPNGMLMPFEANSEQNKRIRTQLEASTPLKKQLWQQTIKQKIQNQANVLTKLGLNATRLQNLADKVKSGDSGNLEAQAAAYYWDAIYGNQFTRGRSLESPNAQLNYGYAILRSMVARALVASGLLPTIGIFHANKYNAFCLADDIMEPYRPFVDWEVMQLEGIKNYEEGLTREQKITLLKLPQLDIVVNEVKSPMFHAISKTTASVFKCFDGELRKISYPTFE
jgi:CRISPR-associated protein Cas1